MRKLKREIFVTNISLFSRKLVAHVMCAQLLSFVLFLPGYNIAYAENDNNAIEFAVPAGPLGQALRQFAEQAGVFISFQADQIADLNSDGLDGMFDIESGFQKLMQGTGYSVIKTNSGYTLRKEKVTDQSSERMLPITVTGELLQRTQQETQTSVSVVSGEELDRSTDKDLFDTVDRLPNINAQGGGFGFVIRGITSEGPGGAGTASAISVQIDGANVPNGQALRTSALSTWDLEQVEVLRGPQSTQQGPNALAGAIILRSKDPEFEQEFKARADYGTFSEQRLAAVGNIPINDQFAARFSYEDYRSDGDIESDFNGDEIGEERLETIRGKLRYRPNDALDIILGHTYSDNKFGQQGILEDRFSENRVDDQETNSGGITNITNLRINYELNNQWSFQSETSYLDSEYLLDNPLEPGNPRNTPAFRTVDDTSLSQELKLKYDNDALRAVIGAYYLETDKDLEFEAFIPDASIFGPPFNMFPGLTATLGNALDVEVENYAVFGELEYDLTSQWMLVAGVRYDWEEQDTESSNSSFFDPDVFMLNGPPTTTELDADYSAFLPKLGIIYKWNDDISISFTAQRGYRAGGAATEFVGNDTYEYDPEYTNNFELAFRSMWLDDRLTVNSNIFYTDYEDIQVSIPGPSNTFADARIENAAEASLWGVEVLSDFNVTPNLNVFANIGYTKTEFDDFILNIGGVPTDVSGNEFAQAPRWTGSIGASYDVGNGWLTEFDVNFTDKSYYTAANDPGELNSSFGLVNARISYQSNSFWEARLFARNLFDRQYLSRKRVDGASTAGDSRVIGFSLSFDY